MADATQKGYHEGGSAKQDGLRNETGEKDQKPVSKKENVSTDRGSFKIC